MEYAYDAKEDGNIDKALAYVEVINVMQAELGAYGCNLNDVGLDFIAEKELL